METSGGIVTPKFALRSPWKLSTCVAVTVVAYFGLARFSLLFVVIPERIAGFWLPNGLLIGMMLIRQRSEWKCLLSSGVFACVVGNLFAGVSTSVSLGISIANGVECWLAAWAFASYAGTPVMFRRLREVFGFLGAAAIPSCACGGLVGASVLAIGAATPEFWPVWRVWMVADLMGMMLITPLVIAWNTAGPISWQRLPRLRVVEACVLLLLVIGVTVLVFDRQREWQPTTYIGPYALFPLMLWAALRFGLWASTAVTLVVALIAVAFTMRGLGPFAFSDDLLADEMRAVQIFLFAAVLTNLVVVALTAERRLAEEQLDLVIRGTDAGIWDWNLLPNEVHLSPRWKSMLGFQDHEIVNNFEAWESRIHPDDHSRALATFRDYLSGKLEHYELEHRLRHRDGKYRWVLSRGLALRDSAGRAVRVAGSNLDITTIKHVEEALRESERHFSAAFDDSPIGMDQLDLSGRFLRVNAAYCRMLGYRAEQLIGKHIRDITHPADLPADQQSMCEFLSGQRQTYQTEKRYLRSDGQMVWALLNVTVVTDAEGQPLHFFGQVQDITQLKRTEAELRRQAEELERSNQELDEFAYIASHDLKAPLRGIANLSKWIAEDTAEVLHESTREHLTKLRQRVARMDRLLDDLLQYSRAGQTTGEFAPVHLTQFLRAVVDFLAPSPGISIILPEDFPVFTTHRTPLELVFRNLIGNAIKHHHSQTMRIEVSAALKSSGRAVEFSVKDDGPGIPAEHHERIFRMFQTLKPRDELEGSGIGLAVVKKVVERQGGKISVESAAGQGSTFRFTWPVLILQKSQEGSSHGEPVAIDSTR